MERKDTIFNLTTAIFALFSLGAVAWAVSALDIGQLDASPAVLIALAVGFGSYLRSQVPRFDLHLVLIYALVVVVSYNYGGEAGVIAGAVGYLAAGSILHRRDGSGRYRNIVASSAIAVIASAAAWRATTAMFGPTHMEMRRHDLGSLIWFIVVSTVVLFAVSAMFNKVLYKFATVPDPRRRFDDVLVNAAAVFGISGIVAGLAIAGLEQVSVYWPAGIIGSAGLVHFAVRSSFSGVRRRAERARSDEQTRVEVAEDQIRELERYVKTLETNGEALQASHEKFRHAAYHDALTGLPNRNYFIDTLKLLLQHSRESAGSNFAILLLDLNRFKTINNSLGHSLGDRLIRNVAERLSQMVREEDMVARFSGDKFGIILHDLLNNDEASAFAGRLVKRVAEPYTLDERQVFTAVKIGVAFGNVKYLEAEDILRDADIALNHAKDQAESCVIFDQRMHIRAVTRMQLETDLRLAVERNEFELYYQPIVGLERASLVGFEALVRWNHPKRGLIPPNEFIPIGERTGLIVPMTIQILHSACSQVAEWQRRSTGGTPLSVAVNLSGKHFAQPDLVDQIRDALAVTGIDPSSLKLELTESAVMDNAETAILMLKQIKETGVQISIDDFGTGYSSLSYLHRFPIDLLKVDRSFVSAMESNSENGEIVKTVIALAKALKLRVVAEGIETISQLHQLRNLGCEYGQGFLFAKPMPVAEVEKLLDDRNRWHNILPAQAVPAIPPEPVISHFGIAQ